MHARWRAARGEFDDCSLPEWCDLCAADQLTQRHAEDTLCWVADCSTCRYPMVVRREHGMLDVDERAHMLAQLNAVAHARFGDHFYVDRRRRSIATPWHAHARPGPPAAAAIQPDQVPGGEPVLGWRYWGDLRFEFGRPWLVGPRHAGDALAVTKLMKVQRALMRQAFGTPDEDLAEAASWWTHSTKQAPPCGIPLLSRAHDGGFGEACVCGVFAYKSLEDMAHANTSCGLVLTLVAGHGPVYWSISDHRGGAWRARTMSLRTIVLSDRTAPDRVVAMRDQFGVPVLLGPLDVPWPRRWVEIARWAKAEGLPALWADDPSGRKPTGRLTLPIGRELRVGSHRVWDWPPPVTRSRLREAVESGDAAGWMPPQTARDAFFLDVDDVEPWLSVGALGTHGLDLVAEQGYTHVLDLRQESDSTRSADRLGITYRHLPARDDDKPKFCPWFDAGVEFAREAHAAGGRLLVNCRMGHHRAPSMTYAILRTFGDDPDEAARKIAAARPAARIRYRDNAERWLPYFAASSTSHEPDSDPDLAHAHV